MAKTLAKSLNNDIFLHAGQFAEAKGRAAYAVVIDSAIKTQRGELQLDKYNGIPFFETVFTNPNYLSLWKSEVEDRIRKFDFVQNVENFETEIDFKQHLLKFDIIVRTDLGDVEVNDVNFNIYTDAQTMNNGVVDVGNLVQDGIFYLPVYKENGVQVYRQLTQVVSDTGVSTELSETLYVKNSGGTFVVKA